MNRRTFLGMLAGMAIANRGTRARAGQEMAARVEAARALIRNGEVSEEALNRIEMAVRAYDP